MSNSFDIIFYHAPCADGSVAVWALKKINPDATLVRMGLPSKKPDEATILDKRICFVDICPDSKIINEVVSVAQHVTVIDHHKTAQDYVKTITEDNSAKCTIILDMNRSAAQIAFDYANPDATKRPFLVDFVADNDLWKHEIPNSREIFHFLWSVDTFNNFDSIEKLAQLDNFDVFTDLALGMAKQISDRIATKAKYFSVAWMHPDLSDVQNDAQNDVQKHPKFLVAMITNDDANLRSDVPHKVLSQNPLLDYAVYIKYDFCDERWIASIRSLKADPENNRPGIPDLLKLIFKEKLGGGGHDSAGAFNIKGLSAINTYFTKLTSDDIPEDLKKSMEDARK